MKKNNSVATTTGNNRKSLKKVLARKGAAATATQPAPKAAKAEAEPRTGVNIGKTSGKRVMAFQDWTFEVNDQPSRRLTDEELAAAWRAEFPQSRAVLNGRITADMVRSVRHLYNNGTGGHGTVGVKHESAPYVVQDGKRVQVAYTRTRKTEAEPAQPAATKAKGSKGKAAAQPAVEARPKAKVVIRKTKAA